MCVCVCVCVAKMGQMVDNQLESEVEVLVEQGVVNLGHGCKP